MSEEMRRGKVKWFSSDKGYGFISRQDGEDVFFHFTVLENTGFKTIEKDCEVEFEMEDSPKGPKATRVVPVD